MAGLLRLRSFWVAWVVVVAVVAGAVVFHLQSQQQASPHARTVAAGNVTPPAQPSIGSTTVTNSPAAEVLTVVRTAPGDRSIGASLEAPITLTFNLPVNPASVKGYFLIRPNTPGTFTQGALQDSVVFTPTSSFGSGTSVSVDVRQGLTSRNGVTLSSDYDFSFITVVSARNVLFDINGLEARTLSLQSGHTATGQVYFGDQVPNDITLQTFAAKPSDLLAAQVYDGSYTYLDQTIPTASMRLVGRTALHNNDTITLSRPDGIYLLLAADAGGQYGAMWLVVTKLGVLMRQDDLKIVVAGEDLGSGSTTTPLNVVFYNLAEGVHQLLSGTVSGTAEFSTKALRAAIDIAVATAGSEVAIVPLSVPETNADIKSMGDLSALPRIFMTTDRAGYQKGETVQFAGVVRLSNDQAYTVPSGMTVIVSSYYGEQGQQVQVPVAVAADGSFSGSFAMPAGAFNADGTDAQMTLAATTPGATGPSGTFWTVIDALGDHPPAAKLAVQLDKATYVAGDTITATITGVDASGQPLAGKTVSLAVYSTTHAVQPSEITSYPEPGTWGTVVSSGNLARTLDATGKATYAFNANLAQAATDQEVTLVVSYGSPTAATSTASAARIWSNAKAVAARTAIVYQAQAEIYLLPSRSMYQVGDTVVAPLVVEDRAGERVSGMPVVYELDSITYNGSTSTTTVVASGTVTTDAAGLATAQAKYSGPETGLVLRVKARDAAGNVFQNAEWVTFVKDLSQISTFSEIGVIDGLVRLSVTTDKIAYSVGDTAHLTVTAPATAHALLSVERGRIHSYKWVPLVQGANSIDLPVRADLKPGFTLTFAYFSGGTYWFEGLPIVVNDPDQALKVVLTPDAKSYTAGQTAHVAIAITDAAGNPVAGSLIADGYNAGMSAYKLIDQGSIVQAFYTPTPRFTDGSSSLLGIGSFGGRCGGGPNQDQEPITNPGKTVVWQGDLPTSAGGQATVDVPITGGPVRLVIYASTTGTEVGQAEIDISLSA